MPALRVFCSLVVLAGACGTPPPPRPSPPPPDAPAPRMVAEIDDCAPVDGKAVEPLLRKYEGVARHARCQREVYTIMGFVTRALGQPCEYCHVPDNYTAMTERKRIANWMAAELVPSLEKHGGGELWCKDCHAPAGKGRAKILGDPRNRAQAIEWMTTHLVEKFDTARGEALRCKTCHQGNLGTKEWNSKVILTDHLPPIPEHAAVAASDAAYAGVDAAGADVSDAGADVPDAGPR
jgi:hypothetical protein